MAGRSNLILPLDFSITSSIDTNHFSYSCSCGTTWFERHQPRAFKLHHEGGIWQLSCGSENKGCYLNSDEIQVWCSTSLLIMRRRNIVKYECIIMQSHHPNHSNILHSFLYHTDIWPKFKQSLYLSFSEAEIVLLRLVLALEKHWHFLYPPLKYVTVNQGHDEFQYISDFIWFWTNLPDYLYFTWSTVPVHFSCFSVVQLRYLS